MLRSKLLIQATIGLYTIPWGGSSELRASLAGSCASCSSSPPWVLGPLISPSFLHCPNLGFQDFIPEVPPAAPTSPHLSTSCPYSLLHLGQVIQVVKCKPEELSAFSISHPHTIQASAWPTSVTFLTCPERSHFSPPPDSSSFYAHASPSTFSSSSSHRPSRATPCPPQLQLCFLTLQCPTVSVLITRLQSQQLRFSWLAPISWPYPVLSPDTHPSPTLRHPSCHGISDVSPPHVSLGAVIIRPILQMRMCKGK